MGFKMHRSLHIYRANLKNILNLNKREVVTFLWFILTAEVWPVTSIH